MKKPNLQRLAQGAKIYLRKASPTILSGLGAAGVIVTSVLAVRATPKALRKIRADSKANHKGDPEAYSKLEAVKSAWVCYIPAAISGTATIFCIFGANVLSKHQQAALTSAYALLNDSYNNYKDKLRELYGEEAHQKIVDAIAAERLRTCILLQPDWLETVRSTSMSMIRTTKDYSTMPIPIDISKALLTELFRRNII